MNKTIVYILLFCIALNGRILHSSSDQNALSDQNVLLDSSSDLTHEETPYGVDVQPPPLALAVALPPALVPRTYCTESSKRIAALSIIVCAAFGLGFGIGKAHIYRSKHAQSLTCESNSTDISNSCFIAQIDNCGECDTSHSQVSCPTQGVNSTDSIIYQMKKQLERTCDDKTQYCIAQAPCQSEDGYYGCGPTNLIDFIKSMEIRCARKPKRIPKFVNKKFLPQRNQTKAWDKRRTTAKI